MNEMLEDELERANQERRQIVRKYKLGRNFENQINEWVNKINLNSCNYLLTTRYLYV